MNLAFTPTHRVTVRLMAGRRIAIEVQKTPEGYWTGSSYIDARNIVSVKAL